MRKIVVGENINIENNMSKRGELNKEKYKVLFSKTKEDMISLSVDNNEVKMKYISKKNESIEPLIDEDGKKVVYKDVEEGIDLIYELEEKRVKESFVINKRNDSYCFNFEAKIGNLVPEYNEETKSLELRKDNKVVYRMLPPFMIDSKKEVSKKCSYEIEDNEKGLLTIKLVADAEWINEENRAFPVIIDPTFEITNGRVVEIESFSNTYSNGLTDEVFVGYKNEVNELKFYSFIARVYVENIENINLADSKVFLEIPVNYCTLQDNDEIIIFAGEVEGYERVVGMYKPYQLFINNMLRLDITEEIKHVYQQNGYFLNVAILLRKDSSSYYLRNDYYKSGSFNSGVYKASLQIRDSKGERAKVVVEPKEESKLTGDYSIGYAGTTSVNIQTGKFKHRINDLSIRSGLLVMNIDHIYDSTNSSKNSFGAKWSLSVIQNLKKEIEQYQRVITYLDDEGYKHLFYEKWFYKDGNSKIYVDKDSITLSEDNRLVLRDDNSIEVEYEVINDEGYNYVSLGSATNFDAKGKEYKYYINYNGFKKQVIKGRNNYLQFIYYEDGKIIYADSSKVEQTYNGYIYKNGSIEKKVFLSSTYTSINFSTLKASLYYGENKVLKEVSIEKVPVYENLDDGLYTSGEIENLEYEMNQAKYNLKEVQKKLSNLLSKEKSYLVALINLDLNGEEGNLKYNEFVQLENELSSIFAQKEVLERNAYFTIRNFNGKLKEQKNSPNDYIIDPNGTIILFDGYGRMVGIGDKNENRIEIIFDKDSNIEAIKSKEEQIVFKYNNNKLEALKKSNGESVKYSYNNNDLIEIDKEGRKAKFTYLNGLQVFSDINEEIIVDNATSRTIKVKKYVEPNIINGKSEFIPFIDRTLIQNDKYEFSKNYNHTVVTDRIKNEVSEIDFDSSGQISKKIDDETITYANYYNGKVISYVQMKKNYNKMFTISNFSLSGNKYTCTSSTKKIYSTKSNAYCLMVELEDLPLEKEDLKTLILSVSYLKKNETYNFKQVFIGRDNEVIVLPFFLKGEASNLKAIVESNVENETELSAYIKNISIVEIDSGILNEYGEKDRLWKIKNNEGKTTYLSFEDRLPIVEEFKDWNGKAVTIEYNYNDSGKLVYSIDSKGNCINYLYQDSGKKVEKREYNVNDASLVRSEVMEYDENENAYITKGSIKDKDGNYPVSKSIFYPGTDIIKTVVELDGSKTEWNINPRTKKVIGLTKENDGVNNSISYIYNRDFLTTVKNNGTEVNYTYDGRKRIKSVRIKGYDYRIVENSYEDNITVFDTSGKEHYNGSSVKTIINGIHSIKNVYSKDGKLIEKDEEDSDGVLNLYLIYNDDNLITEYFAKKNGYFSFNKEVHNSYDISNNLTSSEIKIQYDDRDEKCYKEFYYSDDQILEKSSVSIDDKVIQRNYYIYDSENILCGQEINDTYKIRYGYDALKRVNHKEIAMGHTTLCHSISYLQQDGCTLDLVAEDYVKVNGDYDNYVENHKYSYDVNGRVTSILIDDKKIEYKYDGAGRLIYEYNELLSKENKYSYDRLGNIISKRTYELKDHSLLTNDEYFYSCDSKHLLVAINNESIEYDMYGRMISCKDKSYKWNEDGSLRRVSSSMGSSGKYAYNEDGIRYFKELDDGTIVNYSLNDGKIIKEVRDDFEINYIYDVNNLIGMIYNGEEFMYEKNAFGDIVRIYDRKGYLVGEYQYDAYGNTTIVTDVNGIASINPFRFKGYYYDEETSLYYITSRYYDPEIGRFISPDSVDYLDPTTINGLNLYAYCGNDPVNRVDPTGHFAISSFLIGLGISALIGAVVGAFSYTASEGLSYAITGEFTWSWAQFAGSVIGGAIGGAISMIPGMGTMAVAGITGALSTGIGMHLQNQWEGTNYSVGQILFTSTINGLVSASAAGIFESIPIKGLNRGRGSYEAIAKQINTKFFNGTIKHISYNTFSKVLTYNMIGSLIGTGYSGIMDVCNGNDWLSNLFYQRIERYL